MSDYTCQCPGPSGTARYTVMDAARMQFYCLRCKTQLVPAEVTTTNQFTEDDDTVLVAPGAAESDDPILQLLAKEAETAKRRDRQTDVAKRTETIKAALEQTKMEEEVQKRTTVATEETDRDEYQQKLDAEREAMFRNGPPVEERSLFPPLAPSLEQLLENHDKKVERALKIYQNPDVRIIYAHGVQYCFSYDEIDNYNEFILEIEHFIESWRSRKNAILDFFARGRRFILNAELVAGIDYKV